MTIHITPEPEFSYVSFESNVAASNYGPLIARVVDTFQPGKFVVTVFANKVNNFFIYVKVIFSKWKKNFHTQSSPAFSTTRELEYGDSISGKWKRKDLQFCRFPLYDLTYAHYCKFPSWELQATSLSVGASHPFPSSSVSPNIKLPWSTSSPVFSYPFAHFFSSVFNIVGNLATQCGGIPPSHSAKPKQHQKPNRNNRQSHFPHQIIPLLAALTCVQILPFVLVYCIEECSPLVLFSWWRNKISWDASRSLAQRMQQRHTTTLCWQPTQAKVMTSTVAIVVSSIELDHTTYINNNNNKNKNIFPKSLPNAILNFVFFARKYSNYIDDDLLSWYTLVSFNGQFVSKLLNEYILRFVKNEPREEMNISAFSSLLYSVVF